MPKEKRKNKEEDGEAVAIVTPKKKKSKKSSKTPKSKNKLTLASSSSSPVIDSSSPDDRSKAPSSVVDLDYSKTHSGRFFTLTKRMRILLHPCFLRDPLGGVTRHLDSMLLKYTPSLSGVPISHSGARFLKPCSLVSDDDPLLHCDVHVSFVTFSPRKGDTVTGTISSLSKNHISLIVHGVFNASVPRRRMRKTLTCDDEESFFFEKTGAMEDEEMVVMESGSRVRFSVEAVVVAERGMLSIQGSMIEEGTGLVGEEVGKE